MKQSLRLVGALAGAALVVLPVLPAAAVTAPGVPPLLDTDVQVLTTSVQDPTSIDVAPDGTVVIGERKGGIKVWTQDGRLITAGRLPVAAAHCTDCAEKDVQEGGLHGLLLARDFLSSRKVYLRYAVPGSLDPATGDGIFRLATFTLTEQNVLDLSSEKVVLDTPVEWKECCHYGGDLEWMKDGTLLMSVGDDTNPFASNGFAPIDGSPGRAAWDARRTSGNPADLRGKVLRLNADGTAPADNPRKAGWNPYVDATGFRSNYRIGYDPTTDTVIVGNVGPDATNADANRGPAGVDEVEVIPSGGGTDHGWPYCIADNKPYNAYDFQTGEAGPAFSCTGKVPAEIYYTYNQQLSFPTIIGNGSRTAIGGPVYRYSGPGALALPARFQGQALFGEWSRNQLYSVPMKTDGHLDTAQLLPFQRSLRHPIDMRVGPDGALYVAEYGTSFENNTNSRISRVVCKGCTPAAADYGRGAVARTPVQEDPAAGRSMSVSTPGAGRIGAGAAALALIGSVVVGGRRRRGVL